MNKTFFPSSNLERHNLGLQVQNTAESLSERECRSNEASRRGIWISGAFSHFLAPKLILPFSLNSLNSVICVKFVPESFLRKPGLLCCCNIERKEEKLLIRIRYIFVQPSRFNLTDCIGGRGVLN